MHLNYARIAFHGNIQPHPPSAWHYTSGYIIIWALCLRPFNELASINHQRATKKNMDCTVFMLFGIMVLSHLPRDSKGEDSCNTGISVATYWKAIPIQDSVRGMLFDWWEIGTISLKVVWRCVKMDNGRQSVTDDGITGKRELCVDNWDSLKIQEVSHSLAESC